MSVATVAMNELENRLPKVIDARKHGIIDYCHAAFFLGMAYMCRKSEPRAAVAALVTGSFVLIQSLLTDYPYGVKKVIPFRVHGQMDAALLLPRSWFPKSSASLTRGPHRCLLETAL